MTKIYLQEKIKPVEGKYIVVGDDGFLTTGDIFDSAYPQLIITTDAVINNISDIEARCNGNIKVLNIEKVSELEKTYSCLLPEFGFWEILATTSTSSTVRGIIDVTEIKTYNVFLSEDTPAPSLGSLDDTDWYVIKQRAEDGTASSYWSIGDRKAIYLNGTVGTYTFNNNRFYAYIIGFDHNAELERLGITFQLGYLGLNKEDHNLAFIDNNYNITNTSSTSRNYQININSKQYNGWQLSNMNTNILNNLSTNSFIKCLDNDSNKSVIDPYNNTNPLPSKLHNVVDYMIAKPIYSNNGNTNTTSNIPSNITETYNKLFLLSSYELTGQINTDNDINESYVQKQYDYYKVSSNTSRRNKYKHNNPTSFCTYWTRSKIKSNDTGYYSAFNSAANIFNKTKSITSLGISPAFHLGPDINTNKLYIATRGNIVRIPDQDYSKIYIVTTYLKINNGSTEYYEVGYNPISEGDVIDIYASSGFQPVLLAPIYTRVRLNGQAVGSSSNSWFYPSKIYSYKVEHGVKNVIVYLLYNIGHNEDYTPSESTVYIDIVTTA